MITEKDVRRCAELANEVQSAMQNYELELVLVVLIRLAVMSARADGVARGVLEDQFKHVLDDMYSAYPSGYEENTQ